MARVLSSSTDLPHIETETKWPTFGRRHFKIHFLKWKLWYFITMTSSWVWWRFRSPASRLFTTIYSGADQRKHQSSASLAFVRGIHRWPVNSPHKGPVTRKMFPFDDVIMSIETLPKVVRRIQLMSQHWFRSCFLPTKHGRVIIKQNTSIVTILGQVANNESVVYVLILMPVIVYVTNHTAGQTRMGPPWEVNASPRRWRDKDDLNL